MKKILLFLCISMFIFSSCVDVKIASPIDKISYFSLYNLSSMNVKSNCKIFSKLALFDIYAYTPYDDTSIYIFDVENLQISSLSTKKWISSPKEMLKMALIYKAQEKCFEISMPPLGTQKLDKTLKLSLLSLQILYNNGTYQAQMSMFYELFSMKNYQNKSGVIESLITLDSLDDTSLAPNFAKASDEIFTKLFEMLQSP